MSRIVDQEACRNFAKSSRLEWIVTNGRGGYAMGSVSGANTRRYHGHLVAATNPPDVRTVLLASVEAYVTVMGEQFGLSTNQYVGTVHPQGYLNLASFEVGDEAKWTYEVRSTQITKTLRLTPGEGTATIVYRNEGPEPVQLSLRPLVCHKFYHQNFRVTDFYPEYLVFPDGKTVLSHDGVNLTILHPGAERTATTGWYYRFEHPREAERGLDPVDDLFCPCELRYFLSAGDEAVLVASIVDSPEAYSGPKKKGKTSSTSSLAEDLGQFAGEFLVKADNRTGIIAGYPWFTDWGRDTMISLPGLCLETGRTATAREILRSYAGQMRQGIIPNRFTDAGVEPDYNTVDATLWFVNAVYLTLEKEWDGPFAMAAMRWLEEVYEWHQKGTFYQIHVDPEDGLLSQGELGVQLTWMDAKVGDWVVTPRHGKPVEVNGLWVNALRVMDWLAGRLGNDGSVFREAADRAQASMEEKFWHEMMGHYLDTVDPDDASLRPNQLIAMSLPFAPLTGENARRALGKVSAQLVTPFGLRTLGPNEPGYIGRYEGPMGQRDAAYHQGTVWPWLLGPYVSAVVKLTGDKERARASLSAVMGSLDDYGLGGIAEVYDGDEPHRPGGCPWQAWSAAEVLRAWRETESDG